MKIPVWLVPDRRKSPAIRSGKRKSPAKSSKLKNIKEFSWEN